MPRPTTLAVINCSSLDEVKKFSSRTKGAELLEHFKNMKINVTSEQQWLQSADVTVHLLVMLNITDHSLANEFINIYKISILSNHQDLTFPATHRTNS